MKILDLCLLLTLYIYNFEIDHFGWLPKKYQLPSQYLTITQDQLANPA